MSNELSTKALHEIIWDAMCEHKVTTITVHFSGSGDDGSIQDITPEFVDILSTDPGYDYQAGGKRAQEFLALSGATLSTKDWTGAIDGETTHDLGGLVRMIAEEMLQGPEVPDWYNGDGGNGEIVFTLECDDGKGPGITMTVNVARIEYDTTDFEFGRHGEELTE